MKSIQLSLTTALLLLWGGASLSIAEDAVSKPHIGHSDHADHKDHADRKGHDDHKDHDDHKAQDDHAEHKGPDDRKGPDDNKGHDDHAGHGHVDKVVLTGAQIKELGIEFSKVEFGATSKNITRPAVVKFNQERVVHIVPLVSGVVHKVFVSEGDRVEAGDVIAIIESRELAKAAAEYIARYKRKVLMQNLMEREEDLRQKRISRLRDFLEIKTRHGEADIEFQKAKHNLFALGLSKNMIAKMLTNDNDPVSKLKLIAPLNGIVTDRHVVRGEFVSTTRQLFVIADMKNVWIDITIYPRDLGHIEAGQNVTISSAGIGSDIDSQISFVSTGLNADTRTAIARTIVANKGAHLHPGMFVQARIYGGPGAESLTVPESALQTHEGKTVVFVARGNEFSPKPVIVGTRQGGRAQIISGLRAGEQFVSKGGFVLRAQLAKASFGDGHNH